MRPPLTANVQTDPQPAANGTADDARILSIVIGGKTVGARLEEAIAAGRVIRRDDGKLEVPRKTRQTYLYNNGEFEPDCTFLNDFMFAHIYGQTAVPIGCSDCYKVKVTSATMRQVMAVKEISEGFSCSAKSGAEIDNRENQTLYGSYFYLLGLDKARAVYRQLRGLIDAEPRLGPSVKMVIKRGCTNYEHACGPSDRYTFDPRLAEIEKYFKARFVRTKRERKYDKKFDDPKKILTMIRTAYRIGDDTYKDFTGGKNLLPPTVTYDPEER